MGRGLWLDEGLVFGLELFLDCRFSFDGKFSPDVGLSFQGTFLLFTSLLLDARLR